MNRKTLIETWTQEEQQPFIGWDFSYLDGRMLEEQAPWSYSLRAAELMRQSTAVLDLETGGGERFLKLRTQLDYLLNLQTRLDCGEGLRFAAKKYLIEAKQN